MSEPLSIALDTGAHEKGSPSARRGESGSSPGTWLQEALWRKDQTAGPLSGLHVFASAPLPPAIDLQICQERLNSIVRGASAFRTTFRLYENKDVRKRRLGQIVSGDVEVTLRQIDVSVPSNPPGPDAQAEIDRITRTFVAEPFDLARGPLLRCAALKLAAGEYLLLACAHRIVSDERSIQSLMDQLTSESWEWKETLQFVDYAIEERKSVQPANLSGQMTFWKEKLKGNLPSLDFPVDFPRAPVPEIRFLTAQLPLDRPACEGMKELGATTGATPYDIFVAAIHVLLYRYTRQEDILIGAHTSPEFPIGVERPFGSYRNTLLLRTNLSGNATFRELLMQVMETLREASQNGLIPCEAILEELTGNPAAALPYQVVVEHAPDTAPPDTAWSDASNVELAFSLLSGRADSVLKIRHNAELFAPETSARLLEHLRNVIAHVAMEPETPLSEVRLMSAAEERRILFDWNRTELDYPRHACLHQLFEGQAKSTPGRAAIRFEGHDTTYAELDARASQLAHHLQSLGAGPDVLVGILVDRSVEMIVAVLGVLKAGSAYVPLDPSYPAERIEFMVSDSRMPIVVTQHSLADRVARDGLAVVCMDSAADTLRAYPADAPLCASGPESLAYVIYTSGSTGKPKGVQIPHRAAVNFMCSMQKEPGLAAEDVLLAVTTLSFDIAGLEIHLPLSVGACIVVVPRSITSDGPRLLDLLARSGITTMQATPATWRLLIDSGWAGDPGLKVLCGGEALPRELARELLERCRELWNMYGPTETTIWSTVYRVRSADLPLFIGRPIGNTQVYILDQNQHPVPTGAPGELYLGGDGVARGYLNRPDLTAEKFVPDPFSGQPGARMYRTGDLVRYSPTGDVEFSGRLDHQVKIRGFRIELGEIETALSRHAGIRQSVVAARDDGNGMKRLAAYFIPEGSAPPTAELRTFLKQSLPEYMVPATFTSLEAFPLTPNNKVDRKSLPAPEQDRSELEGNFAPPRTATEIKLAAILQSILGLTRVGVNDNFFELGADSLTTARVFAQVSKRFGKDLLPTVLFQTPTVAGLAALLDGKERPQERSCLIAIRTEGSKPPLFCIHGGAGTILFYHDLARHLGPDQPVYALQALGLYGEAAPHRTVEEMAAHYIPLIQRVQSSGPYYFAGYCFGAIIGVEMAHQLRAQGQQTALLASLNGPCPLYDNGPAAWEEDALHPDMAVGDRVTYERERLAKLPVKAKAEYLYRKVAEALNWRYKALLMKLRIPHLRKDFLEYRYKRYLAKGKPLPADLRDHYFLDNTYRAERQYRATKYAGDMVIFRGKGLYADPLLGWQDLVDEIEVHDIPGRHGHHRHLVEEPAVGILAQALARSLDARIQRNIPKWPKA